MIEIAVLAAHDEFMRNAGNEVLDDLDLIELRIPFDSGVMLQSVPLYFYVPVFPTA